MGFILLYLIQDWNLERTEALLFVYLYMSLSFDTIAEVDLYLIGLNKIGPI